MSITRGVWATQKLYKLTIEISSVLKAKDILGWVTEWRWELTAMGAFKVDRSLVFKVLSSLPIHCLLRIFELINLMHCQQVFGVIMSYIIFVFQLKIIDL